MIPPKRTSRQSHQRLLSVFHFWWRQTAFSFRFSAGGGGGGGGGGCGGGDGVDTEGGSGSSNGSIGDDSANVSSSLCVSGDDGAV